MPGLPLMSILTNSSRAICAGSVEESVSLLVTWLTIAVSVLNWMMTQVMSSCRHERSLSSALPCGRLLSSSRVRSSSSGMVSLIRSHAFTSTCSMNWSATFALVSWPFFWIRSATIFTASSLPAATTHRAGH